MLSKLQARAYAAREEGGFTLIELLVVLIIIGVLLAIAVPAYLGFKERAEKRASSSNVRAAMPGAEAYYGDQSPNSYAAISVAALQKIDSGIKLNVAQAEAKDIDGDGTPEPNAGYCLASKVGSWWGVVHGPGGNIVNVDGSSATPCA